MRKNNSTEPTADEVAAEVERLAPAVEPEPEAEEGAPKQRKKRVPKPDEAPDPLESPEFWGMVASVPFELRARKTGYADYRLTPLEANNIGLPLSQIFSSVSARYFKKHPELAAAVAAIIVVGQAIVVREQGLADWRKANASK